MTSEIGDRVMASAEACLDACSVVNCPRVRRDLEDLLDKDTLLTHAKQVERKADRQSTKAKCA